MPIPEDILLVITRLRRRCEEIEVTEPLGTVERNVMRAVTGSIRMNERLLLDVMRPQRKDHSA
jgi:hypothetical protein